jgi:ABC-2 type transport system ATP-binding protein
MTEDLPAGIRQRAGLALSTLHQPRVLFLDEPTAGVDVHNRGLFWELIQDEAENGVTVFVTTHFLEEVDYCDRVAFIDGGRLIADATPSELRRRYSDGYCVELDLPHAAASEIEQVAARIEREERVWRVWLPDLTPETLRQLGASDAGGSVRIRQAPMTDVFRRLLVEAQGAA